MRIPVVIVVVSALLIAAGVVGAGLLVIDPNAPLIGEAAFAFDTISPNADGEADVVPFAYNLARNAEVTISLTPQDRPDAEPFYFRRDQRHTAGDYEIIFSGVVGGFSLPDESVEGEIERRVLPDGEYTWRMVAEGLSREERDEASGTLTITGADAALPLLTDFSVQPTAFTPNQDGVEDRVGVSVFLEKPADLSAYLLGPNDEQIFISPVLGLRRTGEAGRHEFDFDGGIDRGADPPPDGTYTLVVEAQDAVGQRVRRTSPLTIADGGKPRAEILGQPGADVIFTSMPYDERYFSSAENGLGDRIPIPDDPQDRSSNQVTVPQGDMLVFKLVVENYGSSPIRTFGPPPGTVYQQDQLPAALGEIEQDGTWRIGIECETAETNYPWRWGLGAPEDLVAVEDPTNDNVYYYLMPGQRAEVWGAVRLSEIVPTANPQTCFAGLIHEGVDVSIRNARVGARSVLIAPGGE